ncbi:MAG: hypothetical protein OXU19_19415 [bacterium]|nr:hypothetical protein [bacterium]MDE0242962.1 hypothetical protein [bacterium]MDE0415535.1 hypothetical protein [bacterium]
MMQTTFRRKTPDTMLHPRSLNAVYPDGHRRGGQKPKAVILSFAGIPFQRSLADNLQELELKRELAGAAHIEGADFTKREFEKAVTADSSHEQFGWSQRSLAISSSGSWAIRSPSGTWTRTASSKQPKRPRIGHEQSATC